MDLAGKDPKRSPPIKRGFLEQRGSTHCLSDEMVTQSEEATEGDEQTEVQDVLAATTRVGKEEPLSQISEVVVRPYLSHEAYCDVMSANVKVPEAHPNVEFENLQTRTLGRWRFLEIRWPSRAPWTDTLSAIGVAGDFFV